MLLFPSDKGAGAKIASEFLLIMESAAGSV